MTGEGIEIILKDNQASVISANDILTLVNQLIISGAEAIAINDNRYNNNTDIVSVNSKEILVSSKRIVSPYVIKAIGNKKNLESSITIISIRCSQIGKSVEYKLGDNIKIEKNDEEVKFKYAR